MITGYDIDGERHFSFHRYHSGPWYCPICQTELELDGDIFKHSAEECDYASAISRVHDEVKRKMFIDLYNHQDVDVVEIEYALGRFRTDVYFETRGYNVAIEIQKRHQTLDQMYERTRGLNEMGVAVMWVYPLGAPYTHPDEYKTTALERYIEEVMNGSIFYRFIGIKVAEFSFGDIKFFDEHVNREVVHMQLKKANQIGFKNIVDDCDAMHTEGGLLLWR